MAATAQQVASTAYCEYVNMRSARDTLQTLHLHRLRVTRAEHTTSKGSKEISRHSCQKYFWRLLLFVLSRSRLRHYYKWAFVYGESAWNGDTSPERSSLMGGGKQRSLTNKLDKHPDFRWTHHVWTPIFLEYWKIREISLTHLLISERTARTQTGGRRESRTVHGR